MKQLLQYFLVILLWIAGIVLWATGATFWLFGALLILHGADLPIIGDGCEVDGKRYWFDPNGKPYDLDALKELKKTYKNVVGYGAEKVM